jgi:hypothetical protein
MKPHKQGGMMYKKVFSAGLGVLLGTLILSSCPGTPEENLAVGEITIYNIPKTYTDKNDPAKSRTSYKVYVNASNDTDATKKHVAQGIFDLANTTFNENNVATITIPLFKPLPGNDYKGADPDENGGPWSGEANFFSVVISPENAPDEKAIFVKGSMTRLDKSNNNCNFASLYDLWDMPAIPGVVDNPKEKVKALYDDIVSKDNKAGKGSSVTTNPE